MTTPKRASIAIGIDAGGTHTRGVAVDATGEVLARSERAGANPRTVGDVQGREQIRQVVLDLRTAAPGPVAHVMLGSAGLFDPASDEENAEWARHLGVAAVTVDSDTRIAHAAAFGTGPGVVIIAGTGSQCLALGANGQRVSVGGWGPKFGDEGSAHWIATTAIQEALHALDEDRPSALLEGLVEHAGIAPDADTRERKARLLDTLYDPGASPARHARFAPVVARLAERGDPAALDVLRRAGVSLGDLAVLAGRRTGERTVSFVGSVLGRNAEVRASFEDTVRRAGFDIVMRRWEPVFGAVYLAMVRAGWNAELGSERWARSDGRPARVE